MVGRTQYAAIIDDMETRVVSTGPREDLRDDAGGTRQNFCGEEF